jgi:aspartate/methionine/tyrosine aminotransferase
MPLREAVSDDILKYRNVSVSPDNIMITPGGKPIMNFAITMFGEPGVEIIYPDPGFPIYNNLISFTGATPVAMALREENGFSFKADEVLSLITANTRLLILNSPANPTGGVTPRSEMERLAEGLLEFPDVHILSDEIYARMLYGVHEHVSALAFDAIRDRVILLDGWSKTYAMTGWRLGYSVWPEKLISYAERMAINSHSCVNAPAQYAAIAALKGPQGPVDDMIAAFDARRVHCTNMLDSLPGIHCIEPGGAFYTFPNITDTGYSSLELQEKFLIEAGVACIAGSSFGTFGEGYLRVSYANSMENLTKAIERIKSIL